MVVYVPLATIFITPLMNKFISIVKAVKNWIKSMPISKRKFDNIAHPNVFATNYHHG